MQRTGRKGHAQFRVVVQDSRRTPTSGKVVAQLGNFDPHTKVANVDKEKATFYLTNGAQPSPRAARLLEAEGVKLPTWVKKTEAKGGKIRNPEKLRRNQPKEEVVEEAPVAEETTEAPAAEEPAAE
jgi:small subunit ribosomal protein S16